MFKIKSIKKKKMSVVTLKYLKIPLMCRVKREESEVTER